MKINLNKNENKSVTLINDCSIEINLEKGSSLDLFLFYFDKVKDIKINGNLKSFSSIKLTLGDFSKNTLNIKGNINLKEEGAKANLVVRSISQSKDYKNIDISINQLAKSTHGYSDSFGISKGSSTLKFCGVDEIVKGASKSEASLNYKVIVFDKESKGIANPILKIAEDDVKASHGAIVGRLNEDELFYLNSRGLSELESKQLIANGYFSQLLLNTDENIRNKIGESIKGIFNV